MSSTRQGRPSGFSCHPDSGKHAGRLGASRTRCLRLRRTPPYPVGHQPPGVAPGNRIPRQDRTVLETAALTSEMRDMCHRAPGRSRTCCLRVRGPLCRPLHHESLRAPGWDRTTDAKWRQFYGLLHFHSATDACVLAESNRAIPGSQPGPSAAWVRTPYSARESNPLSPRCGRGALPLS
jgi:hypothetical protein